VWKRLLFLVIISIVIGGCTYQNPVIPGLKKPIDNTPAPSGYFEDPNCGIESCHGLEDITCGKNIPKYCTLEYLYEDFCRSFVRCEVIDGKCKKIESPEFFACKNCMENCSQFTGEQTSTCKKDCSRKFGDPLLREIVPEEIAPE
jgi:hypothetical protein